MSRPAACILMAFLVVCSLQGRQSQLSVSQVQAAEGPPVARKASRGGAVRIDFPSIALREARRAGIKQPHLFVRQLAQESNFDPCAGSSAGAQGIAQILASTANSASWGYVDPWMPHQAIRAAAKAMAKYEAQTGNYADALQIYNAGAGAYQKYNGNVPYGETREYVRRIMGDYPLRTDRIFTRPSDLTPRFARSVRMLIRDVESRGGNLNVVPGNGFRSIKEQTRLWKEAKRKYGAAGARRWVSPPFCSSHGLGTAVDLRGDLALAHRLGPKYGIHFKIPNEPWHGSRTGY